jgi:hypothetical protein
MVSRAGLWWSISRISATWLAWQAKFERVPRCIKRQVTSVEWG